MHVDVRAEVVGSLLRPDFLVTARQRLESGQLDPAHFKDIEDRAVDEAIEVQTSAGIDVITDGEQRRYAFFGNLVDAMAGFDKYGGWAIPFRDEQGEQLVFKRPVVVEKLRPLRNMAAEEFTYMRASTHAQAKVTMISAQQAAAYYDPEKSKSAYATRDAYLADVVDLSRREVDELVRLGCTYVQLDAPHYPLLIEPKWRAFYEARGWSVERWLSHGIELDNAVMAGFNEVTFSMHMCRGNQVSRWLVSGGYEPIARQIFQNIKAQRLLLEYDDERSGSFEPLAMVPEDKMVMLGLVTTKTPRRETVAELTDRIREASQRMDLERLGLSPQCGFATSIIGNSITVEDEIHKLTTIAETARSVWH